LTSALDGGEFLASLTCSFIIRERAPIAGLDVWRKENYFLCRE
jgi:hypothetical protein